MKHLLAQLAGGQPLSTEQAVEAFELIMTGRSTPAQTAALLGLVQLRGPTVDEIAGAATVMRRKARPVKVPPGLTAIDIVGTGGDYAQTFNISTAAALVAAAAARSHGVAVAKHGNRSVTSKSGSSQVLEALGVKIHVKDDTLTRCLDQAGLCFCFAPAHHPAMKYAAPVRAELGFRTIFNILGPLTNPAGARRQVIGVFSAELTETIATVLSRLGCDHAMVVHGTLPGVDTAGGGGLDELSTCGPNQVSHVRGDIVRSEQLDPAALDLPYAHPGSLRVDSPDASAAIIRSILDGQRGPPRDIVCLNAAAALVVADLVKDLAGGLEMAGDVIDSGAAKDVLTKLVTLTQADPTPAT
ncbi:MAG: anthranilate phosphoribosyltransferase [Phycisphaeraceae bacterium]